jgi:Calx-beta domain/CHRD domain
MRGMSAWWKVGQAHRCLPRSVTFASVVTVVLLLGLVAGLADSAASAPPALSVRPLTLAEADTGTTDAVFAVRLSRASARAIRVRFATADGSAHAGADYVASMGVVVFKPGQIAKKLPVRVIGDTAPEAEETFFLDLSRPQGAQIKTRRAIARIAASDLPAPFTLRAEMSGAEYVPQPGHPTGRGTVILVVSPASERVAYTITVSGMEAGESGICEGARGKEPTPVLRLGYPPQASGSEHLQLETILEMFRAPEAYCALARLAFGAPGIRGQFSRASSYAQPSAARRSRAGARRRPWFAQ